MSKIRQTKITKFARGKPCTVRVSQDIGCSLPETSVLAHAPSADDGRGYKSPDWWGAVCCFNCHQLLDRQRKFIEMFPAKSQTRGAAFVLVEASTQRYLTQEEINEAWLRGIYATHKILIDAGLIEVKT